MAVKPQPVRDLVYEGTMQKFFQICIGAVVLELIMIGLAARAAATIPNAGDPTYRQICVGVPAFWATVLPLFVALLYFLFNGQTITLSQKAFIYRRGRFSIVMPWPNVMMADVEGRFDRQFMVTSKGSQVVVRAMFFPEDYEEIRRELDQRLASRQQANAELHL